MIDYPFLLRSITDLFRTPASRRLRRAARGAAKKTCTSRRLWIEVLEDRTAPAVATLLQWANVAADWVSGDLNPNSGANQANMIEGDNVPYQLTFDGLSTSGNHTVTFDWQTTKGGVHAFDYLTTYDYQTIGPPGSTTTPPDPLLDTGLPGTTAFTTLAIPLDPTINSGGTNTDMLSGHTQVGGASVHAVWRNAPFGVLLYRIRKLLDR